jgi:AcrR family transcriptional regulator
MNAPPSARSADRASAAAGPVNDGASRPGDPREAPPDRTTPYHHGALAEALVQHALEQVREHGSERVSLRGVAQAVGVSASAAYHHFPDKEALLVRVAQCGGEELTEKVVRATAGLEDDEPTTLIRRMSAIGRAYVDFATHEPNLFRHTFGPDCAQAMPPEADDTYAMLTRTLDAMDAHGLLRRREGVDLLAWTCVHGVSGLVIDGLVPPEAVDGLLETVLVSILRDPSMARYAVDPE